MIGEKDNNTNDHSDNEIEIDDEIDGLLSITPGRTVEDKIRIVLDNYYSSSVE